VANFEKLNDVAWVDHAKLLHSETRIEESWVLACPCHLALIAYANFLHCSSSFFFKSFCLLT